MVEVQVREEEQVYGQLPLLDALCETILLACGGASAVDDGSVPVAGREEVGVFLYDVTYECSYFAVHSSFRLVGSFVQLSDIDDPFVLIVVGIVGKRGDRSELCGHT